MNLITIVCTKCGKPNQTEKKTFRYKIRCVGCQTLVSVGGLEPSFRALPLQEISIVLGILFIVVAPFLIKNFFTAPDDFDKNLVRVEDVAKDLVIKIADPGWQDVRLLYASPEFNEEMTQAWVKIAYCYKKGGVTISVEFPMRFVVRTKKNKEGKEFKVWEPEAIGKLAPPKKVQVTEPPGGSMDPASVKVPTTTQPAALPVESIDQSEWNLYLWEAFDEIKHTPLMRGIRPKSR